MAKNYLIVGGGSGIGKVIAERLAAEGNQVWAFSRSIEEADSRSGIICRHFDVLKDESLPEIEEAIDGLVYCPGSIQLKPFERIALDDFRADLEIN